jgi:methyltransferase (TIGR00027 family)
MQEAVPSRTALRVALRRAAHQMHDARPLVFEDALAVRILGSEFAEELKRTPDGAKRPFSAGLRAWMVARARLAEDTLAAVRRAGAGQGLGQGAGHAARQYVVLGAGLDTFACRNPYAAVRVFEVDHPATQAWKLEMLRKAGIVPPESARFVAVDFERDSLRGRLRAAGFDAGVPTVTAWLGVVPYLTAEAFAATVRVLAGFAPGSAVVFDYSQPREVLPPVEQLMLDSLSARVAQAGEPFRLFFTAEALREELERMGLRVVEDVGAEELGARYFAGRQDGLGLRGTAGRVCVAAVGEGRVQGDARR